jgi:multidrug efflux pump subunit AcrB
MQNLPEGVERARFGQREEAGRSSHQFHRRGDLGHLPGLRGAGAALQALMAPFVNMGSLLLAPLGGAIALHIAGMPVSMPVMIGILMLLGIVAKNSILLLDFAIDGRSATRCRRS